MKKRKANKSQRNNTKKYTQCKLKKEEAEKLLEKLKSNEINMNEVTSLTGVCKKQIYNYLKKGVNLKKTHGSVKPNSKTTFKIMKLLSENYKQSEISKECGIDVSTLSNQCKVLTFIKRGCLVGSAGLGRYNIAFIVQHYRLGVIFYLRFKINSYVKVQTDYKEVIKSLDVDIEYHTSNSFEYDRIRDIIMEKASEDYFTNLPIQSTAKLENEEQIEKYIKFYKRILNDLDIYTLLTKIYSENRITAETMAVVNGGRLYGFGGIMPYLTIISYTSNEKKKKKIETRTIVPPIYFIISVAFIYLLIIVLSLVYYIYYK